jgi:acetolactate synthase regulatory subunit
MCSPALRHAFRIEADPIPDVLLRVLGPFAVRQALIAATRHEQTAALASTVIEVTGLAPAQAEHLGRRLREIACVRSVRLERGGALAAYSWEAATAG